MRGHEPNSAGVAGLETSSRTTSPSFHTARRSPSIDTLETCVPQIPTWTGTPGVEMSNTMRPADPQPT